MSITIDQRIADTRGRSSGFDYLRLILALLVVMVHTPWAANGALASSKLVHSPLRPLIMMILPMFFALSGFLVAGSLLRTRSLIVFIGHRVIRLVPALFMEVMLSALIIGPIFTDLPLKQYFVSPVFFKYFFNIVGHVQFVLPGVFDSNPTPNVVNGQLWTIPYELYCYIMLIGLGPIDIQDSLRA